MKEDSRSISRISLLFFDEKWKEKQKAWKLAKRDSVVCSKIVEVFFFQKPAGFTVKLLNYHQLHQKRRMEIDDCRILIRILKLARVVLE